MQFRTDVDNGDGGEDTSTAAITGTTTTASSTATTVTSETDIQTTTAPAEKTFMSIPLLGITITLCLLVA